MAEEREVIASWLELICVSGRENDPDDPLCLVISILQLLGRSRVTSWTSEGLSQQGNLYCMPQSQEARAIVEAYSAQYYCM